MFVTLEWVHRLVPTLRPRQNGRCFAHDIHKCIFLDESISRSIQISLKCIPCNDKPPSIRPDKGFDADQAKIHHMHNDGLICWSMYASLGHDKLNMHW